MYAVIVSGGKQYKVSEGDVIRVEKLDVEEGAKVSFDEVLLLHDGALKIGTPTVKGAKVSGTVLKSEERESEEGYCISLQEKVRLSQEERSQTALYRSKD